MTVRELIERLEEIEDKELDVVADLELDLSGRQYAEIVDEVYETEVYYRKGCESEVRKCVKIIP